VGDLTFGDLQERLSRFRDDRDWAQFHTLKDLSAAIAVEAAELQQVFLWRSTSDESAILGERGADIEAELADVVIQAMNFALAARIDLAAAVTRKIAMNAERYPADRVRGTATKYTEL
jgi:dCTP diphosphatase